MLIELSEETYSFQCVLLMQRRILLHSFACYTHLLCIPRRVLAMFGFAAGGFVPLRIALLGLAFLALHASGLKLLALH